MTWNSIWIGSRSRAYALQYPQGQTMIRKYISKAMTGAQYEILSDDSSWYGEIPGFQGVWANNDTLEECRVELEEVLEDWLLFSISRGFDVPVVDGIDLKFRKTS